MWVATTNSSLNQWSLPKPGSDARTNKNSAVRAVAGAIPPPRSRSTPSDNGDVHDKEPAPLLREPCKGNISGQPGLTKHEVLNDKLHVLTLNAESVVMKWNVLTGAMESLGSARNFEEIVRSLLWV